MIEKSEMSNIIEVKELMERFIASEKHSFFDEYGKYSILLNASELWLLDNKGLLYKYETGDWNYIKSLSECDEDYHVVEVILSDHGILVKEIIKSFIN